MVLVVPALVGVFVGGCTEPQERPLNLIVVTIDTLRADALGVYGHPGGQTPEIDAFAAEAVVFENAVSPIGTTAPAHASLFTGLYPRRHGVRWNRDALADRFTTLAELLAISGYDTASFVSSPLLFGSGVDQGMATRGGSKEMVISGDAVSEAAREWLATTRSGPFFLWLHYFEPHTPYRLTEYSRGALGDYDGPLASGGTVRTVYALGVEIPFTPEDESALRILYDGEVREGDRLIGEMLEVLRRRRLLDHTLVILTSDHGQSLGEHGRIGHGRLVTQPVLHVPLLVRSPRHEGRRISVRVGLVDVVPTVLDLLDLSVPHDLDGRSLRPAFLGQELPIHRYFAEVRSTGRHIEWTTRRYDDPRIRVRELGRLRELDPGKVAVFVDDLKGVWRRGELSLFDLADDPLELAPTVEIDPATSETIRALLASYHDNTPVAAERRRLDEALRSQLQALGYLD